MAQQILPPSESWRLIDAWLETHVAADFALLNPPATADEIRHAEQILGAPMPGDLAESLQCHNGVSTWATILPEQSPLAVSGIVDHWQTCMTVAAENDGPTAHPWDDEPWWHRLWVPWAESADGATQVIDLRPGPDVGRLGWAGHSGGGDFTDSWPDLASLLHAVAQALHEGGDVRGLHPYLTTQGGMWWDEEGCSELNGHPLRTAPVGLSWPADSTRTTRSFLLLKNIPKAPDPAPFSERIDNRSSRRPTQPESSRSSGGSISSAPIAGSRSSRILQ